MKSSLLKGLYALVAIAAIASISVAAMDLFVTSRMIPLTGNTPVMLNAGRVVAHADPNLKMSVVVGLKLRDQQLLDKLIRDQGDPTSADYGKWLTPDEFNARFAPLQADVDATVDYLKKRGLTIVEVTPNRLLIVAEGTTAQLESAFRVRLNKYKLSGVAGIPNGVYVSNATDPRVPANLAGLIESVAGLDDITQLQSRAVKAVPIAQPRAGAGPHGYTPQDISALYGYPTVVNPNSKSLYSGAGQTVAVATAYGYLQSDVQTFWKQFGIHRTGSLTNVPVSGTTSQINSETTLDVEVSSSLAPGADVIVYEGVNPKFSTFTRVYNRIVTDNKADVMTISWGACEEITGSAEIRTESMIFRQAAVQGTAVFVATGDDGAYDCPIKVPYYSVDYPSADTNVTAIGGTSLYTRKGKRAFEVAWSGSGGGMSKIFGRPSYQYGTGIGAVQRRHLADAALDADPQTGYAVFFDGRWEEYGGTSAGTPAWAALWSSADEAAARRLGPANPAIYRAGRSSDYSKLFIDILHGNNGANRGSGYPANPGYDHPTGWGVPRATELVEWLSGHPAPQATTPQKPGEPGVPLPPGPGAKSLQEPVPGAGDDSN